jgi:hypothetical protein
MPDPIRPTRVTPAAEVPPPRPAAAPAAPPVPPGEADAWWTAHLPPREVLIVHHVHQFLQAHTPPAPPAEPEEDWTWSVLWAWARWRHAGGVLAALAPVFGGWSLATGWGRTLQDCRTEQSIGGAWTLGLLALLVTATTARWRPRWYTAAALTTALFGIADMASPYDLVTFFTGVHQ